MNIKIFTENIEETAKEQLNEVCKMPMFNDSKIRIMPDVHAGAGCVIGFTSEVKDKIIPNLVGVDLNCGIKVVKFKSNIDLEELDNYIKLNIPSGFKVRQNPYKKDNSFINKIKATGVDMQRAELSLGTLGGGNHFIEIDKDTKGYSYLLIHTGSRQFGLQIAKYYQQLAVKKMNNPKDFSMEIKKMKELKQECLINDMISNEKKKRQSLQNKNLAYLEGEDKDNYLHDVNIAREYAQLNRDYIAEQIVNHLHLDIIEEFTTVHNYIGTDVIMRKGAVSAYSGEKLIIPMNMRDGSLICIGKGNADWNYSAPHGAGRVMSRTKAKKTLKLEDYISTMKGIYSSSVCENTLDEAPSVYKPSKEIMDNIKDTVRIVENITPIYNFKASN